MTLVLETGTGIRDANSYVTAAFVTNYLTSLGRETENTWSTRTQPVQEAACIAASQYVDTRWGGVMKGSRQVKLDGRVSLARITITGNPAAGATTTVTLSSTTYTLVATLDSFNDNEIELGADAAETAENIVAAINADADYVAKAESNSPEVILLSSPFEGESFNDTPLSLGTGFDTFATVTGFQGGQDVGSQPMEFPRSGLFDPSGRRVLGIPLKLKQATAEYAVRAVSAQLYRDPSIDDSGRTVNEIMEKVGPIEERTVYEEGSALSQRIKPYPAADNLLRDFVLSGGRTIR